MRREMKGLILVGLFALVGCGGSDDPGVEVNVPAAAESAEPAVVSPLEMMKQREKDVPVEAGPADVDAQSEPPIETPVANAVHLIAGRSVFPEVGEVIEQMITAKKLSEEDQFSEPIDASAIPDVVPWTEAKRYVGYEITVQGKIVDVGQSRDGKVNFLNFHQDWRDKFYMVVFDDLAKTLPQSVDATFRGKMLRVTGMVEDHRGRPQIKILSMDQVEFVGE